MDGQTKSTSVCFENKLDYHTSGTFVYADEEQALKAAKEITAKGLTLEEYLNAVPDKAE